MRIVADCRQKEKGKNEIDERKPIFFLIDKINKQTSKSAKAAQFDDNLEACHSPAIHTHTHSLAILIVPFGASVVQILWKSEDKRNCFEICFVLKLQANSARSIFLKSGL